MNLWNISVIAIIGVMTALILKNYKPEFSILVILVLSFLFFSCGIQLFGEMKSQLELLQNFYKENQYYYKILFKIIGITYLCEFTSGVCKDAGYQSISGQVELLGKLLIMVSGMPVLLSIVETIWEYKI